MTFTYTYRDKAGAVAHGEIEAANRVAAFEHLKSKGIAPLALCEGKNKAGESRVSGDAHAFPKWVLIVSVLIAMGACVWWWREAKAPEEPVKTQTKHATKKPRPASAPKIEKLEAEKKLPAPPPSVLADFQSTYPRKPGHLPLPGGNVITFTPPKPGTTTEVYTVNGKYLCDSEGNFVKYEPPKLFDNRFENTIEALAMNRTLVLSSRTKQFSKEDIEKYLSRPITINADDTPDIVDRKSATAAMKEEIRDYIQNGGTYEDYVDKLHDRISSERSLHREAMREMVKLMSEGDVEGARIYRKRIDAFLSENGYLGLKLPEVWQKQLETNSEPDDK